jgi:hypothetical protein
MLKRSYAILMSLALVASHSSFAQPKPAQAEKKDTPHFRQYIPEDKSFTMLYPADWKIVPGGKGPVAVSFVNPKINQPGQAAEFMNLMIIASKGDTLEQLAKAMKDQFAAKPGITPVEDAAFTVGNWKTHRFVYDVKAPNNITSRAIQFIMVKDASAYVISFHMPPENYTKENQDRAFELCGTFKIGVDPGAVATTRQDKTETFDSKELGFSLTYPTTWGKQALDQKGVALALARRASAGKVPQILMVMADTLDPDDKSDLKEMETRLVASTNSSLKDGKVIEAVDSKLGGQPARRVILGGTRVSDDHQGRVILTFCIKGRATFALMAGGPIEDFEGVKSDVDKIIASFTFQKTGDTKSVAAETPAKSTPTPQTETPATPAAPTAFDSPALGVKFTYPATWTAHKSADPTIALMLLGKASPGKRPSTILLISEAVPPATRANLKTQADITLAGAKASLTNAKVIESADVKVGTEKARKMVLSGQASVTKAEMRSIYLLFQHGSDMLTLTGQSTAEDFAALTEAFDGMVSSMELAVPAPKRGQ